MNKEQLEIEKEKCEVRVIEINNQLELLRNINTPIELQYLVDKEIADLEVTLMHEEMYVDDFTKKLEEI